MKKIMLLALVALCGVLNAAVDTVTIGNGESVKVSFPAKVARIEVLSSAASGTATVKAEKLLLAEADQTVDTVYTNFTYVSISTNDVGLCTTNVTAFDQAPFLPPAPFLQSYVTNVSYRTETVTNLAPYVAATVTNAVGTTLTCSAGFASQTPDNAWLVPGDVLSFTGTATGKVTLILEK